MFSSGNYVCWSIKFPLLKKICILQSEIQLFHLYDPNENKNMIKYFFADNKSYYPNLDDYSKSNFGLRSGRAKNSVVTMKVIVQFVPCNSNDRINVMVIQKMLFQNKLYFSPVTNHHERSFQFFLACEAVPVNEHNIIYYLLSRRHNKIT